jgi:DNA polymerase III delta subunit
VKRFHAVQGPHEAGPGERHEMLERARRILAEEGADPVDRFDIPGRGAGEEGSGALRGEVERVVPALQSGSLFGGRVGVLVVDAQNLLKHEAAAVAELASAVDPDSVTLVLVGAGSFPAPLSAVVRQEGQLHAVKAIRERDAAAMLVTMARERRIRLEPGASAALLQRFGTDVGALARALDQLTALSGPVTSETVVERFRNRPDEPLWLYVDAVSAGDVGAGLRRLSDFLTHGHPLALLAAVETDLRRKALAAAAPSQEVLEGWLGARPNHYPVTKAWRSRGAVSDGDLHAALQAVARTDIALKSAPEPTHRITLERLTVALARWYGGR